MNTTVFWDIMWCSTVGKYRRFGRITKIKAAGSKTEAANSTDISQWYIRQNGDISKNRTPRCRNLITLFKVMFEIVTDAAYQEKRKQSN